MYDVEKCSAPLENAAGFVKLDGPVTKWRYVYTLGKQLLRSPERCTDQNTTGTHFSQVQIPVRILVYDWDP